MKQTTMHRMGSILLSFFISGLLLMFNPANAQDLPLRYPTLELFTNTPCPICGSQNPGLFSRLANYEGQYHLISFYPGKPYTSCIFYTANIPENSARWQFYVGELFGTPTVAINGIDFKSSNGVNNAVLEDITGGTSWLEVMVDETTGTTREVDITLEDHVGGSLETGQLFAVIVEKEILYNAPNGETIHHNVFRKFLTATGGDEVDLSVGTATISFEYEVNPNWQADQVYVIAWLMDPDTKEIYNSGTRFDEDFVLAVGDIADDEKFLVYPNPAPGKFTIALSDHQQATSIKIFNAVGALMFERHQISQTEITMDGSAWPEGNYVVRVKVGEKELSKWVKVVH